jgi:hypothetical protein
VARSVRSGGAALRKACACAHLPTSSSLDTRTHMHLPGRPALHARFGAEVWFHAQVSMIWVARHITLCAEGIHASLWLQPLTYGRHRGTQCKGHESGQRASALCTSNQAGRPRTAGARVVEGDTVPAVARVHVHALHLEQVPA